MSTIQYELYGVKVHSKAILLKYPENIEKYSQMKRNEGMVCVSRQIDSGYVQLRFVDKSDRQKYFELGDKEIRAEYPERLVNDLFFVWSI